MRDYAEPGMSTLELDAYGYTILKGFGAIPAPKKDYNFPGYTCISVNHEVCHGVPSGKKILRDGDLVNIDVSAALSGYYGDNGSSFILGNDHQKLQPLVNASQEILHLAIQKIRADVRIAEVGALMEKEAKRKGFQVIKNICGHGIGRRLHEAPREIPCFWDRGNQDRFRRNTTVAVETFISTKACYVHEAADGWTLLTKDRSFVAQHEHTLVVTDGKPLILTEANGI